MRKALRILVALGAILIVAAAAGRAMGLFSGKRPDSLGVTGGRLVPCKPSPNCVSSQADAGDAVHYIAPLAAPDPERAFAALKREVRATPRVTIVTEAPQYLYAEYRSLVFGFVDDVEFWLDPGAKVIQVRSASRLGRSDLGVNRARVEALRARLGATGG